MKKVKNRWSSAFEQRLVASSKVQLIFFTFTRVQFKSAKSPSAFSIAIFDVIRHQQPMGSGVARSEGKNGCSLPSLSPLYIYFFLIKNFHLCLSQGYIEHRDCSLYFGMDYRRATRPILLRSYFT